MNLVAECTTMCAPCSNGRHRYGVANVLSITSGRPGVVGDLRPAGDVEHVDARVADRLGVEHARALVDRGAHGVEVVRVDEAHVDAEARQLQRELVVRAAVEVLRRDDAVAARDERQHRDRGRGHAGGRRERPHPALEHRHALLEGGVGRVDDARVGVAEAVEVEQVGRVLRVLEDVGRRLVDRLRARAGGRVDALAGVDLQRVEAERALDRQRACARAVSSRRDETTPVARPTQLSPPNQRQCSILMQRSWTNDDAGRARALRRRVVAQAELQPDRLRAERDGLVDDAGHLGLAPEDVDDLERPGLGERRHGRDAEHLVDRRVDRASTS